MTDWESKEYDVEPSPITVCADGVVILRRNIQEIEKTDSEKIWIAEETTTDLETYQGPSHGYCTKAEMNRQTSLSEARAITTCYELLLTIQGGYE